MRKEIYKTNVANVDKYGKLSIRMGEDNMKILLEALDLYHRIDGLMAYTPGGEGNTELEVTVAIVQK